MRLLPLHPARLMSMLALAASVPATAQVTSPPMPMTGAMDAGQPPCPVTPASLPPELAGWFPQVQVTAATGASGLSIATIQPGRGVLATLAPVGKVAYPVAPGHAGNPGSSGGLIAFVVPRAGTWRVALGAGAWIDVVRDGRAVPSSAHGHGPACSPVRKTVDFALGPGRYVLQVTGNKAPTLALMVAPVRP